MSISLADLRFRITRGLFLVRRGLASLRNRGLKESWRRLKLFLVPPPPRPPGRMDLYFPAETPFEPFTVPRSESPRASIVIPVYNQFAHTLACLRALAEHPPQAGMEIIVVDDGSSDATAECLGQVAGLRYHRRAQNGGFIAACNDGASLARGDYLVMLNNDTVPQPGWLDALLHTFATCPQAGLVGAQLLYPDGMLQEAGGVVFADGSAWNYGRFDNPDHPRYSYLRDADYCSGAAIAIPRGLFESLGGFDTRYSPAYYEDTDLAFAVRAAGRRVLYQPFACVVHKEGATAGTDTGSGVKSYQIDNGRKFSLKWKQALQAQPAPGKAPAPAMLHAGKRQVLIIDALTPQPDRDSGSLRLSNLIRLLQEEGAHVCFVADNPAHAGAYTAALQQGGVEVWYAPHLGGFGSFLREQGARFDTVMLCRHYVATAFLPLVAKHAPQAKVVFDTVDLHYLRERRGAEMNNDEAMLRASEATRVSELAVMARADTTLVVSNVEKEWLAHEAPGRVVEILSNLHQVAGPGEPFEQRRDLVFVGGFRHPPNVDAAVWFAREVMPAIRARLPQVAFHCIGSDPSDAILALSALDGVVVHGHVPDLVPAMEGMRVAVAPLRYGAGVKGKVNLSMAHGQPVVATTCAVEGMHLQDGRDVLVADDAQAFAEAVLRLYQDEGLWNRLALSGLDNVARHFSLDAAREVVRRVFFAPR